MAAVADCVFCPEGQERRKAAKKLLTKLPEVGRLRIRPKVDGFAGEREKVGKTS
jgi:hypothetical protein